MKRLLRRLLFGNIIAKKLEQLRSEADVYKALYEDRFKELGASRRRCRTKEAVIESYKKRDMEKNKNG